MNGQGWSSHPSELLFVHRPTGSMGGPPVPRTHYLSISPHWGRIGPSAPNGAPPVPRTHYLSKYPLFLRNLSKSGQRGGMGVPRPRMLWPFCELRRKSAPIGPSFWGGGGHIGGPHDPRCKFWDPWDVSEKIPPAIYLNGFGLAVSWTRFARLGSSQNLNICLEGTPSAGQKSLVTVRPCLGVKRSKK